MFSCLKSKKKQAQMALSYNEIIRNTTRNDFYAKKTPALP
jgi:hypothetical protein